MNEKNRFPYTTKTLAEAAKASGVPVEDVKVGVLPPSDLTGAPKTILTSDQVRAFLSLASALSPENLYCDGEISHAQATKKYKALRKQWQALEIRAGRRVSEDEIWAAYLAATRKNESLEQR